MHTLLWRYFRGYSVQQWIDNRLVGNFYLASFESYRVIVQVIVQVIVSKSHVQVIVKGFSQAQLFASERSVLYFFF